MSEGTYEYNADHAGEAIDNLIGFFKEGPRNQAMLQTIMEQVQAVEDAALALFTVFDIDVAEGEALNILGRILGEPRYGRSDGEYRRVLNILLLVLRSSGTWPQMLQIAQGLSPEAAISVREIYPNMAEIGFDTLGTVSLDTATRFLRKAKASPFRLLVSFGVPVGSYDETVEGGTVGSYDETPPVVDGFEIGGTS